MSVIVNAGRKQYFITISIVNPTRCNKFSDLFYFCDNTLHVSDGLSIHQQEFKTAHTATGTCLKYTCCCMYSLELLMMEAKTVRNM
jgi:hypothetical protein